MSTFLIRIIIITILIVVARYVERRGAWQQIAECIRSAGYLEPGMHWKSDSSAGPGHYWISICRGAGVKNAWGANMCIPPEHNTLNEIA